MNKVIKGRELFKMIAEGEIDKNTKVTVDNYGDCTLGFIFEDGRNLFKWLDEDFELIEDEIDIQEIKELNITNTLTSVSEKVSREENLKRIDESFINNFYKINDLVKQQNIMLQWAKQLDRKIKEKE